MKELIWAFKELGVEAAIECCKKAKVSEAPFMSKVFLNYLKEQGGLGAVLSYIEFLCTECCETKEAAGRQTAEEQESHCAQTIEKWEQFHTELGCLYVQSIKKHL